MSDRRFESGFQVKLPEAEVYSNIKLLAIAAAFVSVTIALVLLQPRWSSQEDAAVTDTPQLAAAPAASLRPAAPDEVSRNATSLLAPVAALSASEAVSRQLRQPIRLTDTNAAHRDLPSLTRAVLTDFGHAPGTGDRLQQLLMQALAERQSNAYIDALLNTAAARGDFAIPARLERVNGRLDTETLLSALVARSKG